MKRKVALLGIVFLGAGHLALIGEQPATPAVFTAAQAEAGRTAYENSCGRCHTYSLQGRKGIDGEVPPLASLPGPFLKFIGSPVHVPALMGRSFVQKYGAKKVSDMYTLFRGAADTTPVADLHMSDDTLVNITAYILERNGAKPGDQPLTTSTGAVFKSVTE